MPGYQVFVGKLISGEAPTATPAQLEALLHWLAGRRNHAADVIETAFKSHGVPSKLARRHTLTYLDSSLFYDPNDYYRLFGLKPDCSGAEIRTRHKQLLQVFHPDRHQDERAWFTARTEQLNRAYAYLKTHHDAQQSRHESPASHSVHRAASRPRTKAASTPGLWQVLAANKHRIRKKLKAHLGNPERFEKRLLIVIYAIPLVLLAFVYLRALDVTERYLFVNAPENGEAIQDTIVEATESVSSHHLKNRGAGARTGRSEEPVAKQSGDGTQSLTQDAHGESQPAKPTLDATAEERTTEPATPALVSNTAGKSSSRAGIPVPVEGVRPRFRSVETGEFGGVSSPPPAVEISNLPDVEQPASIGLPSTDQRTLSENRSEPKDPAVAADADQEVNVDQRETNELRDRERMGTAVASNRITQTHEESANSSHVRIDDTIAVKTLLTQYQIAYNLSRIDRMRQLFEHNAVIGDLVGRPAIEDRYVDMFDSTSRRRLIIKDASIYKDRGDWLSVVADYSVNWSYPNGASKAEKGQLMMQVTRQGDRARIRKLEHMTE